MVVGINFSAGYLEFYWYRGLAISSQAIKKGVYLVEILATKWHLWLGLLGQTLMGLNAKTFQNVFPGVEIGQVLQLCTMAAKPI